MDFRELEYFVTIAQEKNLTRAAKELYVSQPTLTKFLQKLESEQGIPLFQRCGKQLLLTYAGERFLYYANELLSLQGSLTQEINDIRKLDIGRLRVGLAPFRCSFALPAVLPPFHEMHPNISVEILEDSSSRLNEELLSGNLDLAFFYLTEADPRLEYDILEEDRMYAILRSGHPIAEKAIPVPGLPDKEIRLEWLQNEVFIMQNPAQRHGEYIIRELRDKHITPAKILRSTNMRAGASLAVGGYGVAFLSGGLLRHFNAACSFDRYLLKDVSAPLHFAAAYRKDHYKPRYCNDFIELMRQSTAD